METFAMESSLLRTRKLIASGKGVNAADMCAVFLREAMDRAEISSRSVMGTCSTRKTLRQNMAALHALADYDPIDAVGLRRKVASRLLSAAGYTV
jgi:hypothetical protein